MNSTAFLGQYIPKKSLIHSLNPVIKILVFTVLLSITFAIKKVLILTIITTFILLLMYLTKIRVLEYLKINKIFIVFALIMSVSNFILKQYIYPDNFVFFENFRSSFLIFIRLFLLAMTNSIFLFTTSTNSIIKSIEFILHPLKYFKINVREISLTIAIAIKFLPIIFDETNKIILTQKSRGTDFKTKNLFKKVKNYIQVVPPLIIFTLRKANTMSYAIFSRCYSLNSPRTKFRKIKIHKYDIIFLLTSILMIIGVIICNNMIN